MTATEQILEEAMHFGGRLAPLPTSVAPERPRPTIQLGPLMKSGPPARDIENEKAWHRTAAFLVAKGWTNKDIAAALDKSENMISLVTRQPWFNETVAEIINQAGLLDEGAINMLRGASASFASTIIMLATTAKSEAVRLSAAQSGMDRIFGRPVQTVQNLTGSKKVSADPAEEIRQLEAECQRLQQKVQA